MDSHARLLRRAIEALWAEVGLPTCRVPIKAGLSKEVEPKTKTEQGLVGEMSWSCWSLELAGCLGLQGQIRINVSGSEMKHVPLGQSAIRAWAGCAVA